MLGHNPFTVRASEEELKPMRSFQHPIPAAQKFLTDILQNEQKHPIYKVNQLVGIAFTVLNVFEGCS